MNLTKTLLVHNCYQQAGGEDQVAASEAKLLIDHGHPVVWYTAHNHHVRNMSSLSLAAATVWNKRSYYMLRDLIQREKPQLVHFHNAFPLISPAAYYACRAERVAVVQTLHNYRLLCPNALFLRGNHICEDCLGKSAPWPAVIHACYRESRIASIVVAGMLLFHHLLGTWREAVDIYIALTEFARQKFIQGGLPAEQVVVKPNFVHPDPGIGEEHGKYALFVGRLSSEKGLAVLLLAWERLGGGVNLQIVGDGPLAEQVNVTARRIAGMEWLGRRSREEVLTLMRQASFLVFPSVCYEGFPVVIAEAYATGLPVIASELGGMAEIIVNGRTGLHFRPGDPDDLAAKVNWLLSHPAELARMRKAARAEYEAKYTAKRNYEMLMTIYERAIRNQ